MTKIILYFQLSLNGVDSGDKIFDSIPKQIQLHLQNQKYFSNGIVALNYTKIS